ncbi:MAG: ABC transporter substrate-binding protein [Candidatus Bipolaricaulota bacterium]
MRNLGMTALLFVFALGSVGQPIAIGITQIVDHPALNAVRDGIIAVLREAGYIEGQNVRYILSNAQGDFSVAIAIAQNFQSQRVGLVVSIATPTSQAAVQVFQGTAVPVVFSAVTDPVGAGLTAYPNVTGVSDLIDVAGDLALLKELVPGLRRVGMVYNPGEVNSAILTRMAQEAAPGLGLTIVTAAAENSAGVLPAAQSLVGRVDAIYVTTDNTVATALEAVVQVASAAKIPFLMADPTSLERGALVCTGFDYSDHGRMTGDIVVRILRGEKPSQIPVTYQKGTQVWLNLDAAQAIGFTFPQAMLDLATGVLLGSRRFVLGG